MDRVKMSRRRVASAVILVVGTAAAVALAASGQLDTSFGTGGAVTFNSIAAGNFQATAVQPDGKVVAVGMDGTAGSASTKWLVARFDAAGALDTTFASPNGYLTIFGASGIDIAKAVVIDSSGRIDVCGWVFKSASDKDIGVVRLTPGGTFDTSFGTGGIVTTNLEVVPGTKKGTFVRSTDAANSMIVEAGGQIVVAGTTTTVGYNRLAVVRYNGNGTLDTTFGASGAVIRQMPGSASASAIAADGNGGYVCLWRYGAARLVHLTHNGTYDAAFGERNLATDFDGGGGSFSASDLAVQSDGRILVAGSTSLVTPPAGGAYAMLVRYDANGTPDRSYGQNGRAIAGVAATLGSGPVLQADGKAVMGMSLTDGAGYHGLVARFDAAGVLDTSFGAGGIGDTVDVVSYASVALDSAGRIVVAGSTKGTGPNFPPAHPELVRYLGN